MTAKAAARRLGVDQRLLEGVIDQRQLRAVKAGGKPGAPIWLLNREDVEALAVRATGLR